jgi:parvulin-like peptidyl-prolyl isomerase
MTVIVRIDNEAVDTDEFVRVLKLTGQFEGLVEQIVRDKLTVSAAKKQRLEVTDAEIQMRADQFRRVRSLHRAADMNRYLDALAVSLDEFEAFIIDTLYQEKMLARIGDDNEVEAYFKLHSPRFDSVEVSHIVLETPDQAKEMISYLRDEPESFAEMAREHSIADTRGAGGAIGRVLRGSLAPEIEAKVFNAAAGDLLGPFATPDGDAWEIFAVTERHPAALDVDVALEIRRLLRDAWLHARAQEHVIEAQ